MLLPRIHTLIAGSAPQWELGIPGNVCAGPTWAQLGLGHQCFADKIERHLWGREAHLIGPVGPTQLLDGFVSAPGKLYGEMNAALLVLGISGCMQADTRAGCI